MYTNTYLSLKEQITLLTGIFRKVLETSQDAQLLSLADQVHNLSRKALISSEQADEFFTFIASCSDSEISKVSRILQFNVLINNLVEMYFSGKCDSIGVEISGLGMVNAIERLKELNYPVEQAKKIITKISLNMIVTVNPSQITRRSYLIQQNKVIAELGIIVNTNDSPENQKIRTASLDRIKDLFTLLWYSDEVKNEDPSPIEEANWAISVVENNLWDAIPRIIHLINEGFYDTYGEELDLDYSPIKLSSWIGAGYFLDSKLDAHQSKNIFCLSFKRGIKLILDDLKQLRNQITLNYATQKLKSKYFIDNDVYRRLIINLINRLKATDEYYRIYETTINHFNEQELERLNELKPNIITSRNQILEPLQDMLASLTELKLSSLSHGLLQDLIIRIKCFGLALFEYEVVLYADDYLWSVKQAFKIKGQDLDNLPTEQVEKILIDLFIDKEATKNFIPADWINQARGMKDCSCLQSNSKSLDPKLAKMINSIMLIKEFPEIVCNVVLGRASSICEIIAAKIWISAIYPENQLNIITNFERKEVLEAVPQMLEKLYQIPTYLESCNFKQYIMLSYSGAIKDCGNITSNWLNYKLQESFKKISDEYNVKYFITHGRGGTIGRGGSTTHAAILSLPQGALDNGFSLIEQGEMIRFKFGTPELSLNTLDSYLSSTLLAQVEKQHPVRDSWREMMDELSDISYKEYHSIVHQNQKLQDYYLQATPHNEFSEMKLGIALPKFNNEKFPYSIRDVSWLFAWMQNRLILPNWLGSGGAIKKLLNSDKRTEFISMYKNWKFFSTRIAFLEMIYFKVDLGISELYERLLDPSVREFAEQLHKCVAEEGEMLAQFTAGKDKVLLSSLPWTAQSIKVRAINAIPLHLIQIDLICRIREAQAQQNEINLDLRKALRITITAIAAGLRNTG